MKTNKRKAIVRNSIKRIGLDCGNRAREIVLQIAIALGFKIHEDEFGVSAYGGNAIRISDHCTYMQTWVDNETWNAPVRLDVVIEDEPTEAVTQVRVGYDFTITEFVSQSSDIDTQKARMIAYDIRSAMNGNPYANNVRGEKRNLVATHGNSTQQINCNTNMNKNKIRLTESQLHNMISESVKQVLSELDWKTYASAADKERDRHPYNTDDEGYYRNTKRQDAFNDAASKALSKKYNRRLKTTNSTRYPEFRGVKDANAYLTRGDNAYGPLMIGYNFDSNRNGIDFNNDDFKHSPEWRDDESPWGHYGDFPQTKEYRDKDVAYGRYMPNEFYIPGTDDYKEEYERLQNEYKKDLQNDEIGREVDAFNHGRYEYVKGKGWQRKY